MRRLLSLSAFVLVACADVLTRPAPGFEAGVDAGADTSVEPQADAGADGSVDANVDAFVAPGPCDADGGASCDDGVYCNGIETCRPTDAQADSMTHCVDGVPVVCDDGVECTIDRCDEWADACGVSAPDADHDGHLAASCLDANGGRLGDDCDDEDATRHPGNLEVCNPGDPNAALDEDCDPATFAFRDTDGDFHYDYRCCNTDDSGAEQCGNDCDDTHSTIYVEGVELCDALDNNCNGEVDEYPSDSLWYRDYDGDGFAGHRGAPVSSCAPVVGYSLLSTDCNDGSATVHPGRDEVCDGIDNDCNDAVDDGLFCGSCTCSLPNVATVECTEGPTVCSLIRCAPDFLDCDGESANGCETDRRSDLSCGQCGVVCGANAACSTREGRYECGCVGEHSGDGFTCGVCAVGYFFERDATCSPTLTALGLSSGTLTPALVDRVTAYAVEVTLATETITLTPRAPAGATVAIGGENVASNATWQSPPLDLGHNVFSIVVSQSGHPARIYTLTVARGHQEAYLKPDERGADASFGHSLSLSGDTLAVGQIGAVYVFVRSGSVWSQQAYIQPSERARIGAFGIGVSLSGDTLVVGAFAEDSNATGINGDEADNSASDSGAAYVFVRSGNVWSQQAYLKASNTEAGDVFGASVSVSGDTLVVGAFGEDSNATGTHGNQMDNSATDSGAAYVFVRSGDVWSQQAYLKASNTGASDSFGGCISVSGDTLVVGASGEDSSATGINGDDGDNSAPGGGAAYVFVRSGDVWSQQAYLKGSNTGASDSFGGFTFGASVSVSGDSLVVGASGEDSNATGVNGNQADNSSIGSGAAYVFVRSGNVWSQQAYLKASNSEADDGFGASVSVSGGTLAVAAFGEDSNATGINGDEGDNSASGRGAAYVFR